LTLHRLLHGELAHEPEVGAHVEGCERCRAWLEQTRIREQALEQGIEVRRFAADVAARAAAPSRKKTPSRRLQLLAAAAVVLLAVGVTVILWPRPPGPSPEATAIKGASSLKIHCRRQEAVFELDLHDRVRGGDALRFEVFSEHHAHVLGLSIQADGEVSVYVPFGGQASQQLAPGRARVLPGSVLLDSEGGDELLVFVFSKEPIVAAIAREKAREAFADAGGKLSGIKHLGLEGEHRLRLLRRERR
jgi:hypothetical protein